MLLNVLTSHVLTQTAMFVADYKTSSIANYITATEIKFLIEQHYVHLSI